MKRCDRQSDRLIDWRYGLLDEDEGRELRSHVDGCADCTAELGRIETLLGALRAEEAFPREGEVDWGDFRRTTVQRATASSEGLAGWLGRLFAAPTRPVWAAAAVLVVVGGLTMLSQGLLAPGPQPEKPAARVLFSEDNLDHLTVNLARKNTAQYLNETKAVLVTLLDVNIECDKSGVDVTAERAKAMELLRRQRMIAGELNRLPLARAQEVCDDLERLLMEISTLGDCTPDEEIRTLRDVVEKKQILVRMELLSQQLARGGASV